MTEWWILSGVAVIWGSSFLFIAEGLDSFAPGVITVGRLALGFLTLAFFPAARIPVQRADWGRLLALSLLWMAIPQILFPIAQQWIESALAGMLNAAMPLFSAVVAAVLLKRVPGRSQIIGLTIGFGGVVLITVPGGDTSASVAGVALVLLATLMYGIAVNIAVPLQHRYGSLPILFRALGIATALTAPLGLVGLTDSTWAVSSGLALLALGVFGTGIAFVLMATLVGRAGATRGAVAVYFVPIVAILLGVTFRDESVAPWAIPGILLVIVGAYVTSRREARRTGPPPV
jgi:drug/metabolite transporter (DMT)-like permease